MKSSQLLVGPLLIIPLTLSVILTDFFAAICSVLLSTETLTEFSLIHEVYSEHLLCSTCNVKTLHGLADLIPTTPLK